MKTKLMLIVIAGVLITGCDFYKEDVPVIIDCTMDYLPSEPIAIDLSAFIESERSKSFRIKEVPVEGSAEILGESFLVYSPKGGKSDQLMVEIFDSGNSKIGEARVNLEASTKACGIAKFDYAEVEPGGELLINLFSNDSLCSPARSSIFHLTTIENGTGLTMVRPDPRDINSYGKLRLSYHAPPGFTGTVKAFYVAMINVKEEYRDQWNTDEIMINPAEKFEYYMSSFIRIKVE